jgi:DNA repair exonuclease SbcCD ATPase subunit
MAADALQAALNTSDKVDPSGIARAVRGLCRWLASVHGCLDRKIRRLEGNTPDNTCFGEVKRQVENLEAKHTDTRKFAEEQAGYRIDLHAKVEKLEARLQDHIDGNLVTPFGTEAADEFERLQQEKDQAVRAMAEMRKKMHDQEDRIEEYRRTIDDACRVVNGPDTANNGGPLDLAEELRILKHNWMEAEDRVEVLLDWVEELEHKVSRLDRALEASDKAGGRYLDRIEELEEHEAGLLALNKKHRERIAELKKNHITTDQIDELVRCAWTLRGLAVDGLSKTQTPAMIDVVFDRLISMLGIERSLETRG